MAEIRVSQWPEALPAGRGSILDAALKAGVPFPHACRAGECGQCKCRLVHGMIEHDPHAPEALSEDERAKGLILACRARPTGDVEVAWLAAARTTALPVRRCRGKVVALDSATHDITRLRVRLDGDPLIFHPGQFARLSFAGLPARAYSMAGLSAAPELEFHIRQVPGGQVSGHVASHLKVGDLLRFEGPFGHAHLQPGQPESTVLLAGGSGLAPILSILRALLSDAPEARTGIHLYHGVRDEQDLYETEWLNALHAAGRISYRPVLSQPTTQTSLATGFVHQVLGREFSSLAGAEIYVCGPPPMVEAVQRLARERGCGDDRIHADAFHAAPPESRSVFSRFANLLRRRA